MFIRYEKKDGSAVLTRLFGDNPVVNVPSVIDGLPVVGLGEYCFSARELHDQTTDVNCDTDELEKAICQGEVRALSGDYITEVVLPDTVNSIGDLCFYGCRELRSVTPVFDSLFSTITPQVPYFRHPRR